MRQITAMTVVDCCLFSALLKQDITPGFKGVKLVDGDLIEAMTGYDLWSPNSVQMHIWVKAGHSLTRNFIRECFRYPFVQCGKGIVIGVTVGNNVAALELNRRIGFVVKYRVKDGWELGTDLVIQELRREECRWLGPEVSNVRKCASSPGLH